jgi:hypothetical protein
MRWAGYVTRKMEMRDSYKILIEKPERSMTFGRPTPGREGGNKMYF